MAKTPTSWRKRKRSSIYGTSVWKKLRAAKLGRDPVCQICERRNRAVIATTVDHITPLSKGGAPYPPLDQLFSLCTRCHQLKTARDHPRHSTDTKAAFAGSDIHGNPLDPFHEWNA